MTLYDKPTSAPHIYAPPRYDDLPDCDPDPMSDLETGFAHLWIVASALVCVLTYVVVRWLA